MKTHSQAVSALIQRFVSLTSCKVIFDVIPSLSLLMAIFLFHSCTTGSGREGNTDSQTSYGMEGQRIPDRGDGNYLNPILGGDYPDPSVLRVGEDYYMTHSSFEYVPGLLIWHSKDLVNWKPVCNALNKYVGSVFAPDLIRHNGKFYIYFPLVRYEGKRIAGITNAVVTADSPEGPWSDPVDLKVGNIDPGHVVDDEGNRYIHLSGGNMVPLSNDGLSVKGPVIKVYEGWEYPEDFLVEGMCLESPKLTKKNGYYYLTSAEGGTAGPATSHMVVSSRSKTVSVPWEHSPYNPIIHTDNWRETWWSKGHGTLVSAPDDRWWIMYHGYQKGYQTLGRQTLMEPIEWTEDGWFRVPEGTKMDMPLTKPIDISAGSGTGGMPLSDEFDGPDLGLQWRFFKEFDPDRFSISEGAITLKGKGTSPADCGPLLTIPVNLAYEIEAEFEIKGDVVGGLLLFYNPDIYAGIGFSKKQMIRYKQAIGQGGLVDGSDHLWLKLVNDHHQVAYYYSTDGTDWKLYPGGGEVSAYHHNAFGQFLSLRAGIFAAGEGEVICNSFSYKGSE